MLYEAPDDSVIEKNRWERAFEADINQPANDNYFQPEPFVTSTFKVPIQKQKLPSGFLQNNPDTWNDENDFLRASSIVPELKVVNDHAERSVVPIQE